MEGLDEKYVKDERRRKEGADETLMVAMGALRCPATMLE